MNSIRLQSKAKINLFLDILSKREDGYHTINTVYQLIDLSDELEFEKSNSGIEIMCDSTDVPKDESNIVHKSIRVLKEFKGLKDIGIKVKINKNIPVGAGLGGGSSNAGVTLIALNELFQFKLTFDDFLNIAKQIGMDVPFHLFGGRCIGRNRGEIIEQIPNSLFHLVLVNTGLQISTMWAYQQVKLDEIKKHSSMNEFVGQLSKLSNNVPSEFLYNAFEQFIFPHYPFLQSIKDELMSEGASVALMSGSGSTIYGIFEDKHKAIRVAEKLKGKYEYVSYTTSAPIYSWAPTHL